MNTNVETARAVTVLIAGGGMAGLCAAVSALESGARVVLVEKGERFGGSMRLSNGLVWTFKEKSSVRVQVSGNQALQDLVVDSLEQDMRWLGEQGVELGPERPFQSFGHGRTVAPEQVIDALLARIRAMGGETLAGHALERLRPLPDEGYRAELMTADAPVYIDADAVVLVTGGFQGNPEMLARYVTSNTDDIYLRGNPWSTGDGLHAALELGAALTSGMRHFYGHAMVAPPARFGPLQLSEATQRYGNYALALNLSGRRFADESAGTGEETLNAAVAQQERGTAIYIVDAEIADKSEEFILTPPRVGIDRAAALGGPVCSANTLEELCQRMQEWGVPSEVALASIQSFNDALLSGRSAQLVPRREGNLYPIQTPPFYAVQVRAAVTFTCGGLATDIDMRVLRRSATISTLPMVVVEHNDVAYGALPRLFAAGCDVGGISGQGYMGGLATALVTGRKAGEQAALVMT